MEKEKFEFRTNWKTATTIEVTYVDRPQNDFK